ncbi:hypothetical protein [Nitrosomonas sp. ANs5]|uniref:hypothetical protein n=1 Tax=Nitrosomonas sp. ANs5 TaxID=3423941 RepID=UPI003D353E0F
MGFWLLPIRAPSLVVGGLLAAEYSVLSRLWEALSPDPWHALGAKTIELVLASVHLEKVRDAVA